VRLSSIARLYRVRLRARLVQELFAVLGIAIGLALLFSSQVSNTSLDGSVRELTKGIVGQMRVQIASRDPHGVSESLIGQVRAIPGVRAAAPILEQSVTIVGANHTRSVDLFGLDPQLARLGGKLVQGFGAFHMAKVDALLLPASTARALGTSSLQGVRVRIGAQIVKALVVPDLLVGVSDGLASSPVAIAPLGYAQQLSGMGGRLSSVFVQPARGRGREVVAALQRLAGGRLNVRPATFGETLFDRAAEPTDQSTGLFSAISALVGFLFAFNALLLGVPQRRRLVEDLRLDGYTRRMILEVLSFDAVVLGVVASAAGLLLGDVLSIALFDSGPGYLSFAFPVGTQRIVSFASVGLCLGGGMLAALVGVLAPLSSAIFSGHEDLFGLPARASRGSVPWLLAGALVCLAVTAAIALFAPAAAITGIVSLTVALLLALPVLLDVLTRAFDRAQSLSSATSPYLAVVELRSAANRARSIAVAATGAIAVFGSVAIETAHGDLQAGLNRVAHGLNATTDLWVLPSGQINSLATTPFTGSAAGGLARLPEVSSVALYRGSFLDIGDRRTWVIAQPRTVAHPIPTGQLIAGNPQIATERIRAGGWLMVSAAIAKQQHLHIGQSFLLPSPNPTRFRIAGLGTNLGWPPGAIMLNAEDYERAWGSSDPSALEVSLRPGVSATAGVQAVRGALGAESGLEVQTAHQRELGFRATARQGLSRLTQISTLVLVAAVLAMAATMGAMIWQRRVRLADMKVDGFNRGVLWRALMWESALLLGAGCSLGALFGLFGQVLLSRALSTVTGFPVAYAPGFHPAVASFALVSATAMLIVAIPGGLATRVGPAIALSD
jgi:putative ABC transport system permease protein